MYDGSPAQGISKLEQIGGGPTVESDFRLDVFIGLFLFVLFVRGVVWEWVQDAFYDWRVKLARERYFWHGLPLPAKPSAIDEHEVSCSLHGHVEDAARQWLENHWGRLGHTLLPG